MSLHFVVILVYIICLSWEKRMDQSRNILSKVLGRTDIIAIGFGTMVGWGWIMMAASWVTEAGYLGAIIAFVIGGMAILAVGLTYGELTAALPLAGGEFVFVYRAIGKKTAFVTGWIMSLAYLGVAAWEGIALATALNYLLPIPQIWPLWEIAGYQVYLSWSLVGMAGAFIVMLLNIIGVRPAVLFQVMATAAMIVIVLIIFLGGIVFGDVQNIGKMFTSGEGFLYVLFMIPAMLIGFDVIPQSAEEMNIDKYNMGKMIAVCSILSIIWYCILITGISIAAPEEIRTSGILPVADITAYAFNGKIFSMVVIFGGILGIMTTWNGFFLGATRLVFAMGRARVIPSLFGKVNKRRKTPVAATAVVGILCMATPLLGRNALIWFVDMSSLCALLAYTLVAISFVILRRKEPQLERPFKPFASEKCGIVIAVVTVIYTILYVILNISFSSGKQAFIFTIIWLVFGIIIYNFADRERRMLTSYDEELLIFGRAFARHGGGKDE